jgi:hypothetical protein
MKDIIEKLFTKHSFLVVFAFSLLITLLAMPLHDIKVTGQNDKMTTYQLLLFIFNVLCILGFVVIYIMYIEKYQKHTIFISVLIFLGFLVNIFGTIDLYFIRIHYFIISLSLINLTVFLFTVNWIFDVLQINSDFIIIGIWLFLYIFINNIAVSIMFKYLAFKNNKKYLLLTLYYLQGNIVFVNILSIYYFFALRQR